MTIVTIYGRTGCHLCEDALKVLESLKQELNFEIKLSSKPNVNFANYNEADTHACRAYLAYR